ncbi:MAG: amino acid ABC transporter substrate-binding protein [Bacteroidetes bacterium]|nr:amino acid ABC transporter substrate-binding protein [Bacteroidota bacterium]
MRKKLRTLSLFYSFFLVMLLGILVSSCGWLKPARDRSKDKVYKDDEIGDISGGKVYDPETGTWRTVREVNEKVDTVKWTVLSEDKYPPITTQSTGTTGTKPTGGDKPTNPVGTSDVSLLLPFFANSNATGVDNNSLWAINFYAGAKLAYDDLEEDGVKLNVTVLDSDEGSTAKVNSLLKGNDLPGSDLVIGPYKRENVEVMSAFAKKNKVPMVVPFTAQMGLTEGNPYYIQVNPSLKSHCEAITRHVRKQYSPENVVLVALDKPEEKARLKFFQDANTLIEGGKTTRKFAELLVPENAGNFQKINLAPFIKDGKTTVFVVPSWSNETFIYSLLRQLMIQLSNGDDVVVYGMPMWLDFEQIDFEYFEKLKLHVSSASYVDPNDERVSQFKQQFFQANASVPTEEAYLGYDVMLYFGKMLGKYGKDFPKKIDTQPFDVLHGRFEFNRIVLNPAQHKEDLDYYDQLENTFVHILKFQDFHLQPAD